MKIVYSTIPILTSVIGCVSASVTSRINFHENFLNEMNSNSATQQQIFNDFKPIKANSKTARNLIAASSTNGQGISRSLEDESDSYLGNYALKFQNCHSVTQWNGESESGSTDRVLSKRLVRFRLCPISSCMNGYSSGCLSQFGDYVVDIHTFLYYYLSAQSDANDDIEEHCDEECEGDYNCMDSCFTENGGFDFSISTTSSSNSNNNSYNNNNADDGNDGSDFDPFDYAQCAEFGSYYIGPYCSNDGNSIHMGVFSDDTCTSFSSCDESCFYSTYGYDLPYASTSLVSKQCLSCVDGTFQDADEDGDSNPREGCQSIYDDAGKCETKMYRLSYPNESACTYIDGLKHLGNDGVIMSHNGKRSKEAGAMIGLISFSSILLALYVHYLHNKLERAKYHLKNEGTLRY